MASFSLVHGAWHGGWCWDPVRAELEARGHDVHTPDLPCEDGTAGVDEYAAAVPPADVVVGHSLGGLHDPSSSRRGRTSSSPQSSPATGWDGRLRAGFGDARDRDELGRSYYPDPAVAAASSSTRPSTRSSRRGSAGRRRSTARRSPSRARSTSSAPGTP